MSTDALRVCESVCLAVSMYLSVCFFLCLSVCVFILVCPSIGSPFHINVIDPSKATARGDGLDMVQCNQMTAFYVSAPAAQLKDFNIKINGIVIRIIIIIIIIIIISDSNGLQQQALTSL